MIIYMREFKMSKQEEEQIGDGEKKKRNCDSEKKEQ